MALGKLEADLWGRFRDGMKQIRWGDKPILLDRIESPGTGRGIPDAHMTDPEYGDCWLELKVARFRQIALTPLQVSWLTRRAQAGSRCRVLVHVPKLEIIKICDGIHAELLAAYGVGVPTLECAFVNGKANWTLMREFIYCDKTGATCT